MADDKLPQIVVNYGAEPPYRYFDASNCPRPADSTVQVRASGSVVGLPQVNGYPLYERSLNDYEIEIRNEYWPATDTAEVDSRRVTVQGASAEDAMRRYVEKLQAVQATWRAIP